MASFIMLEIDTAKPIISIYAPNFTTKESIMTITIESNEDLDNFQDIYIIDKESVRHNFTFSKETPRRYSGSIQLTNFSLGNHTLYAQLRDTVGNTSNIMSAPIQIVDSMDSVKVFVDSDVRKLPVNITHRILKVKSESIK